MLEAENKKICAEMLQKLERIRNIHRKNIFLMNKYNDKNMLSEEPMAKSYFIEPFKHKRNSNKKMFDLSFDFYNIRNLLKEKK